MPVTVIPGTLSRRDPDSDLEPDSLLLMAGFPDDREAADAATQLVQERQLEDGDPVEVTGRQDVHDTQPVIIMTDIQPAAAPTMAAAELVQPAPRKRSAKPRPAGPGAGTKRTSPKKGGGK